MNFRDLLTKYDKIVIPCLQRDYAQGRTDSNAKEIRFELLNNLFTQNGISFNIVFGEEKNGAFLPIDGQQRLTTLFLLYLYNYQLRKSDNPGLEKFSYETRHSTIDFIKELVGHSWDIKAIQEFESIKAYIENQSWYVWPWMYDPTVNGMLVMLDDIYRKARYQEKFPDLDKITFDFLDMGELGLNETLYLKMNSRGRHLSPFEKIKSGLDGLVDTVQVQPVTAKFNVKDKDITAKLHTFADFWRWEMDRKWSELFWNPQTCEQDPQFMSFIKGFTIAFYISVTSLSQNDRYEYIRDDKLANLEKNEVSWPSFRAVLEKTRERKSVIDDCLKDDYMVGLAKLLNRLNDDSILNTFTTLWEENYSLQDIELNYKKIAFIWTLAQYKGPKFKGNEFSNWKRFVFNMITNTIDDFDSFVRFVKQCKTLYAPKSESILEWLSSKESESVEDKSEQWAEERCKAKALYNKIDCPAICDIILTAEAHPLFEGRIRPLLLSGNGPEIKTECIEKRWENFTRLFNKSEAKEESAVETFMTIFSYCDIDSQLWWDKYVFQNTKIVWKDRIFKLQLFNEPLAHLLNGDKMNSIQNGTPISILCNPRVITKVLGIHADWYIRKPGRSLRPYSNMYDGIRLDQNHVLESVRNLLAVEGMTFSNHEYQDFYQDTKIVWGVRITFKYRDQELQLWDDYKLWMGHEYLKNENGVELQMFNIENSNLKELLDKAIDKL